MKCAYKDCDRGIFWPPGWDPKPEEERFCIFHSPLVELKRDTFEEAWTVYLEKHRTAGVTGQLGATYKFISCSGFIFPMDIHFLGCTFIGLVVDFRGAEFNGEACFDDAKFECQASFKGAIFKKKVSFNRATFRGDASYASSIFSGEARFEGTSFMENILFSIENEEDAVTTFRGNASFTGATFRGYANFFGAAFMANANFFEATFSVGVRFDCATFSVGVGFIGATFSGIVWFDGATFKELANFDEATFSGRVSFSGATFIEEGRFNIAKFHDDVSFEYVRWQGRAYFYGARLKEASLDFIGGNENTLGHKTKLFDRDEEIGFDHINFREAKRVRFEHVDLSRASFLRSQIENIDFIDVWWDGPEGYRIYDERKWREKGVDGAGLKLAPTPALADNAGRYSNLPYKVWTVGRDWIRARIINPILEEYRLLKRKDKDELKEIENLYHQLILNYDRRREYEIGGEFYVRENEVRKIRKGLPANALEYIYQWTSHYGQRWARPLAWSLLFFFLFTPFFVKGGWTLSGLFDFSLTIIMPVFRSMRNNLLYLLSAIKSDDLGIGKNLQLLAAFERLLIYYLLSMFLLALRRKFRR